MVLKRKKAEIVPNRSQVFFSIHLQFWSIMLPFAQGLFAKKPQKEPRKFASEDIPPGLDPRQCFTEEELARLGKDINLNRELPKYLDKPDFPPTTDVRELRIYLDERLCLVWEEGVVIFEIYVPQNYNPPTTAITINGELASVSKTDINGQKYAALDRMKQINWKSLKEKSEEFLRREKELGIRY